MLIQTKNLTKTYTNYKKQKGLLGTLKALFRREKIVTRAVDNINFGIKKGELVGFLGPNGAGKTTTLKMLSGILEPTSGEARILGYNPWKKEDDFRRQFSLIMGQKNQLWWDLPAMESFLLNKAIYEIDDKTFEKNLSELSALLEVEDVLDVPVRKLSLGQRMKCELVSALLHSPKVLFLDEPTIGLDVVAQKNIRDFLKKYNKKTKTTIILTSHYMDDIKELCERVIMIDKGKIMYDGALENLINKYVDYKELKITFLGEGIKKQDIKQYGKIAEFNKFRVVLRVKREKAKDIASQILSSDLPVDDILIDEVDIDEVMRKFFA